MSFWDSSAIVPLCFKEPRLSDEMWKLLAGDTTMIAWWGTPIELTVAFMNQMRAGVITVEAVQRALAVMNELQRQWVEIVGSSATSVRAERVARVHPLPVTSVLQLAAALTWVYGGDPREYSFVSLDPELRRAAALEGFKILPERLPPARRYVPGSASGDRVIR